MSILMKSLPMLDFRANFQWARRGCGGRDIGGQWRAPLSGTIRDGSGLRRTALRRFCAFDKLLFFHIPHFLNRDCGVEPRVNSFYLADLLSMRDVVSMRPADRRCRPFHRVSFQMRATDCGITG